MDIFMGPGTYAGTPYVPDEVAKSLVADMKLREGDTVSKDQIVAYLDKSGLGPMWSTDVAMTLRNMFGVTPTFFESFAGSSLINEMNEVFGNTSVSIKDNDIKAMYAVAINEAFDKSRDSVDDAIIAALSMESAEDVVNLVELADEFSDEQLEQVVQVYSVGGDALVESWFKAYSRPHMIRFMDKQELDSLTEALGCESEQLTEMMGPSQTHRKMMKMKAAQVPQKNDPLARRAADNAQHMSSYQQRTGNKAAPLGLFKHQMRDVEQKGSNKTLLKNTQRKNAERGSVQPVNFPKDPQRAAEMPSAAGRSEPEQQRAQRPAFGQKPRPELLQRRAPGSAPNPDKFNLGTSGPSPTHANPAHADFGPAGTQRQEPRQLPNHSSMNTKPGLLRRGLSTLGRVAGNVGKAVGNIGSGYSTKNMELGGHGAQPGQPAQPTSPAQSGQIAQPGQSAKPSLASRIVQGAKRIGSGFIKKIGSLGDKSMHPDAIAMHNQAIKKAYQDNPNLRHQDIVRARLRNPALAYSMHGEPSKEELTAAKWMGLHHQYKNRFGHDLEGYDKSIHSDPVIRAQKADQQANQPGQVNNQNGMVAAQPRKPKAQKRRENIPPPIGMRQAGNE